MMRGNLSLQNALTKLALMAGESNASGKASVLMNWAISRSIKRQLQAMAAEDRANGLELWYYRKVPRGIITDDCSVSNRRLGRRRVPILSIISDRKVADLTLGEIYSYRRANLKSQLESQLRKAFIVVKAWERDRADHKKKAILREKANLRALAAESRIKGLNQGVDFCFFFH